MTAELQFLNKLLKTRDMSLLLTTDLDESYFTEYKDQFKFIQEHISTYNQLPDFLSFLNKFPTFEVTEVNESNDYLLNALFEERNGNFLRTEFNKMRVLLNDGKIEQALNLFTAIQDEAIKTKRIKCVDIFQDTTRYDAYIERCTDFNKYYITTGFPELDRIIGGWDRKEELATIVARSNMGKSWLLIQCATAAAKQGLRVGFYSGEMSARKVGYRADTLLGHISNRSMVQGNLDIQSSYKKFIDELPTKYGGNVLVLTPTDIGGPATVSSLRAFIERENLDMLCIDQHSLLEDDRHAKNPVEKAANISRDLKNLQVLKQIPIVSVSQQNRSSTENGVGLEHIAQADRIGQDSTVVIFMEQKDGLMTLTLVKSRDSENNKKLTYHVDLNNGKFDFMPEDGNGVSDDRAKELANEYGEEDPGEDVFNN